jgi:hypothetical protein
MPAFPEGDFLLAGEGGHAPLKRVARWPAIRRLAQRIANEKRTAVLRPCCVD